MAIGLEVTDLDLAEIPEDVAPLVEYWHSITPENAVGPAWKTFDLLRIPPRYLPTTLVVDYEEDGDTFRYRYWGREITGVAGGDYTGKTVSELPGIYRDPADRSYRSAIAAKNPRFEHYSIVDKGREINFQRVVRLPLSENGHQVTGFVSVIIYPYRKVELEKLVDAYLSPDDVAD